MNGREAAELIKANTTGTGENARIDVDTVERIMRDPDAARELRTSDSEAYRIYNETRAEIFNTHDQQLKTYVEGLPGMEGEDIRIATVGTEGGINRDFRVLVATPDPANPGQTIYLEAPRSQWLPKSNEIFAGQTGGPSRSLWQHQMGA